MENKRKKKKEDIRTQILKKVKYYRKNRGILFFDESTPLIGKESYTIDSNDIEVLMIKLNRSKKILITTKCLYIIDRSDVTRVDGLEIEGYDYMPFDNYEFFIDKSLFRRLYNKYQLKRHIGDLRIKKRDGSFIDVYLSRRNLFYCLSASITMLQFVTKKYEGI